MVDDVVEAVRWVHVDSCKPAALVLLVAGELVEEHSSTFVHLEEVVVVVLLLVAS